MPASVHQQRGSDRRRKEITVNTVWWNIPKHFLQIVAQMNEL